MRLKLSIDDIPFSANTYLGQGSKKLQIKGYQDEKKLWVEYLYCLYHKLKSIHHRLPIEKGTVITVYNFKGKGRRDPDNYAGKMIHDALVATGFLLDDSFRNLDPFPLAEFESGDERTDIYLISGLQIREYAELLILGEDPYVD